MTQSEITLFYNKYKKRLFNTSLRIVGNQMEAEEIVHDTIIKYLQFEGAMKMIVQQEEAWLIKTCVRGSIDAVRKHKSAQSFIEQYKEEVGEEELEVQNRELWGALGGNDGDENRLIGTIRETLKELSQGYRTVLSLLLFEGYDYEEVSEILGLQPSSVRSQFLRGKIKLASMVLEKVKTVKKI